MEKNEIYRITGTNYKEMTLRLLEETALAAQIQEKTAGNPNPRIGIKPNLVSPTPAMFGATTHPEIVAGIIEYLQHYGFSDIIICEGSWVGDKTEDAFAYCGYHALAEQYGVKLLDTQKDAGIRVDAAGMTLHICRCVSGLDFLINVPVLKGHCQTKVTCALKNMKGLIPNSEKRRFHSMGLHGPIAHLNTVIRQDFIVVDHICGDPDFEEGGNPLVRNCILAAKDPVLTDALACKILHYRPQDVPYILKAQALGAGSADLSLLREITVPNPSSEAATQPEDPNALNVHKMMELNYAVEEVDSCSACYSALIGALDRLQREGVLSSLIEGQNMRFCIGQGYQKKESPEKTGDSCIRIGIGNCTRAFTHCIPGCPPTEEKIYENLRRLAGTPDGFVEDAKQHGSCYQTDTDPL